MPLDVLRLSDEQVRELLASIQRTDVPRSVRNQREHRRRPPQDRVVLLVQIQNDQRHDESTSFRVRCVDISDGGIGFVHGSFLHPGTACLITLVTEARRGLRTTGKVVNCEHLSAHVHRVGVQFDEPIDLDALMKDEAA